MLSTGTFLTWLGFYDNTLPIAATTATYSIDGHSPITFNLNGASAVDTGVQYNQVFFHSNQLSPGLHNLDVVYLGNSATTPLTLYEVFLENNTSSSSSSTSSSSSETPTSSSTSTSTGFSNQRTTNHSSNLGPIIGAVVGGLALIVFAILAIFFLRRRNNRSPEETANINPFRRPSTAALSPLTHYSSSDIFHFNPQTRDLSGTPALSPYTPNHGVLPARMIQVDTATPLSTPRLREQRKGQDLSISRAPQSGPETRVSPSSISGNSSQPTRFVHDEDAGIQLDQHGEVVELLPPVYSL